MVNQKNINFKPKYKAKPGDILSDEIQARGFSTEQFLIALGLPLQTLEAIIKNKVPVSPEISVILGKAFDQSPEFWLNLQNRYSALTNDKFEVKKAV